MQALRSRLSDEEAQRPVDSIAGHGCIVSMRVLHWHCAPAGEVGEEALRASMEWCR